MYPEGSLIDLEGKKLISFTKDSMNPMNEGFVELWVFTGNASKQFIFKKRLSSTRAIKQWKNLVKNGWSVIKEQELAA